MEPEQVLVGGEIERKLRAALERISERPAYSPDHKYRGQNASAGDMLEEFSRDMDHWVQIADEALQLEESEAARIAKENAEKAELLDWLEERHWDVIFNPKLFGKPGWAVGNCDTDDEIACAPSLVEALRMARAKEEPEPEAPVWGVNGS